MLKKEVNPGSWPLARITKVYKSADEKVRVVTVRKSCGAELKKAVTNLIPLKYDKSTTGSRNPFKKKNKKYDEISCDGMHDVSYYPSKINRTSYTIKMP